jgi:parallel beta-helix repeat protein
MKRAMERHSLEEARVIPIILRHAHWEGSPFSKLQVLPANAEPIKDGNWRSIDAAFKDVAEGLEKVIMDYNSKKIDSDSSPMSSTNSSKTIIVDQMHRGDFTTITDAIAAATPGSQILVRSGVYDEGLIIDKPLEIVGDGEIGEVVIRASGKDAILFQTVRGKISNLLIRQNVGEGLWFGVDISQGCLELIGCDITSDSLSCVAVHGNAYPRIISNKIHDGKRTGIYVYENGQGIIEDNKIYVNAYSGVAIRQGGNPILRRNKIYDGKNAGIYVYENGQGVIEDNEIYGNSFSGVVITKGANPNIKHNRINKNAYAVQVQESGSGTIEDNDLRENRLGPWYISADSKSLVKHARNQEK